ncbi:hypothetical protein Tco_1212330 [Tanacetum coccineum]
MIGSCNYKLSTTFKPKEPTFQVSLDVLSLTPFYPAFLITASVPAVYMQELWATVTYQKHHIRFKMNKKSYSFDMETLKNMLQMCLKFPGQKFVDPPFEEEILTFIRELGYSGNIKLLSNVKVDTLPQPWRTFGTIINKCLSGKVTRIDTLRLSRAHILWGLYHQKNVDYVYLLWEDLIYQIENKESRKNKYMFYPRLTKVIINHFMSQDQSIPRRNKTYHDLATRKVQPKPKYVHRSSRTKTDEAPKPSSGKRLKAMAKVAKSREKKQPAHGFSPLADSGVHEELVCFTRGFSMYLHIDRDDEQLIGNFGSSLSFSTHDDEARQEEEENEEDSFDPRVQIPSHVSTTDDEIQGANVTGEEMDEKTPAYKTRGRTRMNYTGRERQS